MKIDEQTAAIVTGGASGLGRAAAEALAAAGIKVAIFDLNEDSGKDVADSIGAVFCNTNILDEEDVIESFDQARKANGQERILIHCAAAARPPKKTVYMDKKAGEYTRQSTENFAFATDGVLVSSYRLASLSALGMASLDPLEDGERGVITLTSSAAAQDGQIGQTGYGSAKAGINGLVLPMARDLMDLGIRVNAIMPGIFATPPMLSVPEAILDSLAASVPFPKRLGKPEEFGSLVLELAKNSYFNGQALRIDGAIRMPPR
ncbi:MAG: SDR family oxidoreductase [Parvularculales bacterium]